jgi:Lrp/AsnC family transcriptional regulator, leucine-responsive regulatory protein
MLGKTPTADLDSIDLGILRELQADAKMSLNRLGECVGLSAPAVMERIRKLEQAGVITGYHAHLDARQVGLDIAAFIGVSINSPTAIASFEAWVQDEPEVLECHHVTGAHTLLVKAKARNTRALEQLISRIRSIQGVERTETMVVLSTHIERAEVALEAPEPETATPLVAPKRRRSRRTRPARAAGG